jgi:hypothetical protein
MLQQQHMRGGLYFSNSSGSLEGQVVEPLVLQAWQVLLQSRYFRAPVLSRARQVQVCMAMYRLVQTHVLADPQLGRQLGGRCAELAAQMPCLPPDDWEVVVGMQEVEQQVEELAAVAALA